VSFLILTHQSGSRKGQTVRFPEGTVRVGREESNQLVFSEAQHLMVSRRHAEITREQGTWILSDLGSTTGTSLNGQETKKAVLAEGDLIRFGEDGPEVLVHFGAAEIGSTILVSEEDRAALQSAPAPASELKRTAVIQSMDLPEAKRAASSPMEPSTPAAFSQPPVPRVPSLREESPVSIPSPAGHALSLPALEQGIPRQEPSALWGLAPKHLPMAAAACILFLGLHSLYLSVQVSRISTQMKAQTEKVNKLEEATGQLIQKLNNLNVNPADVEAMFQKKSEELDRRLERKSREFEQKINMLLDSNPLAKLRWERMQKGRR
jgi:predicted component of type VI protein secretion system